MHGGFQSTVVPAAASPEANIKAFFSMSTTLILVVSVIGPGLAKRSRLSTTSEARSMPPMTLPMHSSSRAGEVILCFISCAAAELTPNGLRISCAIPPMIMPSAASFSPWCICASMARCSTRLRPTTTTPVTSPMVVGHPRQAPGHRNAVAVAASHRPFDRVAIVDLGDAAEAGLDLETLWLFDLVGELGAAHFDMAVAGGFLRRRCSRS